MSDLTQTQRPWFFNLKADGDSAIVRLYHSSPKTIETVISHRIEVDGKKKRIRCIGENCPLCANGNIAEEKIYIHLYDYTDNMEKVWERTNKILPQIEELFTAWNPLNTAVVNITRIGNDFPKYKIEPQNPMIYNQIDEKSIDKEVAKMFSMKRTEDEIKQFIQTGKFPERKPFIPKDEYMKMTAEQKDAFKAQSDDKTFDVTPKTTVNESFDDPFMDAVSITPRKI